VGENPISREGYIDKVLSAYRRTPGTAGTIRRPDRLLAAQLHERGVPLMAVENALVLAAARRMIRPAGSLSLATIRSLAYFIPVIEEVLSLNVSPGYFQHLRHTTRSNVWPKRDRPTAFFTAPVIVISAARAFGANDKKSPRTPSAWMISPWTELLFPILFPVGVTSTKHYWAYSRKRRGSGAILGVLVYTEACWDAQNVGNPGVYSSGPFKSRPSIGGDTWSA
jgi:hypothetical protein